MGPAFVLYKMEQSHICGVPSQK